MIEEKDKTVRIFGWIEMKEGVQIRNFIGVLIANFIVFSILQFSNTFIIYVLKTKLHLKIEEANEEFGNIILITGICLIVFADISVGLLLEFLG